MKKLAAMILALLMVCSMAACEKKPDGEDQRGVMPQDMP